MYLINSYFFYVINKSIDIENIMSTSKVISGQKNGDLSQIAYVVYNIVYQL